MPRALARHDALARAAVAHHRGTVVKMIGDGMHAAFADPLDAVDAALELQRALGDPAATEGLSLRVRCGIHAGAVERRDNDYFGNPVNRAARIMGTAHGGQVLLSHTVAELVRRPTAGRRRLARPGLGPAARSGEPRAHLSGPAPVAAAGLSGAALAGVHAEQSAAAGDDLHRARARARRAQEGARRRAPADAARRRRHRQDATVVAGCRRCPRRLSGRRVVRRARTAQRRAPGAAGGRVGPGRQGGGGASGRRGAGPARGRSKAPAGARQLRAPGAGLRRAGRAAAAGRAPSCGFWRPAASRCASRARRASRCRRSRSRQRRTASRSTPCASIRRFGSSSTARAPCCPRSR